MPTIIEVAQGANQFSTLLKALDVAGLTGVLSGSEEYTVFAPTDKAFSVIDAGTLSDILADKDKLTKILTFHVLPGKFSSSDLKELDGDTVATVEGSELEIDNDDDAGLLVNQAQIIQADIPADNGIIHVIDEVLIPETEDEE